MFVDRRAVEEFMSGFTLFLESRSIEEYIKDDQDKKDELLHNLSEYLKDEMIKYIGTDIGLSEIIVYSSRAALRRLYDDVQRDKHIAEK